MHAAAALPGPCFRPDDIPGNSEVTACQGLVSRHDRKPGKQLHGSYIAPPGVGLCPHLRGGRPLIRAVWCSRVLTHSRSRRRCLCDTVQPRAVCFKSLLLLSTVRAVGDRWREVRTGSAPLTSHKARSESAEGPGEACAAVAAGHHRSRRQPGTTYYSVSSAREPASFSVEASLPVTAIEPVGFRVKSDLRIHPSSNRTTAVVTQVTL